MKPGNSVKIFVTMMLAATIIIILLGAAEGAVRFRQWLKHGSSTHLDTIYQLDPETRLRIPIPNLESGPIKINSLGFRGPEIGIVKPKQHLRIAFLGASTTFCAEVSGNEMTWPALVIEQLRQAYGTHSIDYINGGVPGYTVRSSIRNLVERIAPLQPDVIIIYHATNDLSQETRAMAIDQGIYNQEFHKPSWLSQYSLLWFLVEKNLQIKQSKEAAAKKIDRLQFQPATLGDAFRRDMQELVNLSKEFADTVALVTFSHQLRSSQTPSQQLQAASSALYYMPFMTPQHLLESVARYNEIIGSVANESGVLLIDGNMDIPGDATHFKDSVHFTDAGSQAMAQRVSKFLLKSEKFRAPAERILGTL